MVPESQVGSATASRLGDAITYYVYANSHVLMYPIPGLDGSVTTGERLLNFVWYRNYLDGADLRDVLLDDTGTQREISLPPGTARAEHVAELRATAAARLPGVLAEVEFSTGEPQRYFVPIAAGADGMTDPRVASRFVRMILANERLAGANGVLVGHLDDRVPDAVREARSLHPDVVRPLGAEQSNSSTVIDERAMLKVFRRVDPGIHPEVEILEHLTARRFPHAPTLYGTISHRAPGQLHATSVATLTQFVTSDGDMSKLFRSEVSRFVEHA
eukprot:gene24458-45218_t